VDGNARIYGCDEPVMILDIECGPGRQNDHFRTEIAGFLCRCTGADSEAFRLITRCDTRSILRHHRKDDHRFPAKVRLLLLLYGSEVGIEIDEEEAKRHKGMTKFQIANSKSCSKAFFGICYLVFGF
jgi:hypothetical protein